MSATADLLKEIKDGAEIIGIAPTTLCQRAVKHGGLIRRLENGGRVTLETVEQIRAYIRDHRPSPPTAPDGAEREGAAS